MVRSRVLAGEPRIDGREKDMIRGLDVRTGVLPRTHGSALLPVVKRRRWLPQLWVLPVTRRCLMN